MSDRVSGRAMDMDCLVLVLVGFGWFWPVVAGFGLFLDGSCRFLAGFGWLAEDSIGQKISFHYLVPGPMARIRSWLPFSGNMRSRLPLSGPMPNMLEKSRAARGSKLAGFGELRLDYVFITI